MPRRDRRSASSALRTAVLHPAPSMKLIPVSFGITPFTPDLLDWFRRFSTGVAADRWRLYYGGFAKIQIRRRQLYLVDERELVESFARSEHAVAKAETNVASLWTMLQSAVNTVFDGVKDAKT